MTDAPELTMTPKEAYEARKARKAARERDKGYVDGNDQNAALLDIFDRFVTAVERIADALERPRP